MTDQPIDQPTDRSSEQPISIVLVEDNSGCGADLFCRRPGYDRELPAWSE